MRLARGVMEVSMNRKTQISGTLVRVGIAAGALLLTLLLFASAYQFDSFTAQAQAPDAKAQAKTKSGHRQAGVFVSQPKIYKTFSEDFLLTPGDSMELKFHMEKGAVMVYSWKADAKLGFEMHGQPDKLPSKDYYDSYDRDDKVGKESSYGSFTSPKTGIHGWYWVNNGSKEVNFHLTAAGFFDAAKLFAGGDPEDMPVEDAK
jgi:hypothetical protein